MIMSVDHLLTVEEAAKKIGVSEVRVRQFCKQGRLGRRFGANWAISQDEVTAFKRLKRKNGRPKKQQ